ncbi:MAG TPA: YoaK family protein, partial [Aquaticitalea sp.]|nr:YoaK family protein [Aquaticitalea sp.]
HFALFIYDVFNFEFFQGVVYLLYIVSFLLGAVVSGILIELATASKKLNVFIMPTVLEASVLIVVAVLHNVSLLKSSNVIACLLLFAMGLQNSFVTKISNTIVRTTHLTGLFTDLGIELSQLLFVSQAPYRKLIKSTIKLRLYIISFFFAGGIIGGVLYSYIKLNTLLFPAFILLIGLIFDHLRFRMIMMRRKYRHQKNGA